MDDIRPSLTACHVDGTILVQTVTMPEETPELLVLAAGDPSIVGVVGWIDLEGPNVSDALDELLASPEGRHLVGIRHQVQEEPDPDWLTREKVQAGLRAVAGRGLVYDLVVRSEQIRSAGDAAAAIPELRFVLDHAGNPEISALDNALWISDVSRFAALPNTAVKLSGLVTRAKRASRQQLRPYVDHLLETFGPARILFGSDWPVCLRWGRYEQVFSMAETLTEELSRAESIAVFGGNAEAWYEL